MNQIIIAGVFTVVGATIGVLGMIIQSVLSGHQNKKTLLLQTRIGINKQRYYEKEKLYSEIIAFLPQCLDSCAVTMMGEIKLNFNNEQKLLYNSFKPRLMIYAPREIQTEFNKFFDRFPKEYNSEEKAYAYINILSEMLVNDLMQDSAVV